MNIKQISGALLFALLLAGAAEADTYVNYQYEISVNTNIKGLNGNSDYLDFEFNPAAPGTVDAATAALDGFTSDGTLNPVLPPSGFPNNVGDVSGNLSSGGQVVLGNDQYSDYNQGFLVGSFFDIFVDLNVDVSQPADSSSSFTLALFQTDDATPEYSGTFPLVEIDLDANGNPTVTNSIPDFATVQATPEPGSWALLFGGLTLLSGCALGGKRGRVFHWLKHRSFI